MERIARLKENHYLTFGIVGVLSGTAFSLVLLSFLNRSTLIFLIAALSVIAVSFVFAFARKIVLNYESYSQYHYVILTLIVTSFVFFKFTTDPLFYLDCTMLTVSVTFVFARIGCVKTGCCHGKVISQESKWSGKERGNSDSSRYRRIKLFPTQKIEVLSHALNASLVLCLILLKVEPGMAFILSLCSLALIRFYLEWFRGDEDRPLLFNLFETQWLSILILTSLCTLMVFDSIPYFTIPFIVLGFLILSAIIAILISKNHLRNHDLLSILNGYDSLSENESEQVKKLSLSNGWNLSYSSLTKIHLSFSNANVAATTRQIEVIRTFLIELERIPKTMKIVEGKGNGIFHLIETEQRK